MDDSSYVLTLYSKYMEQCLSDFMVSGRPFIESARMVLRNTYTSCSVSEFLKDIFPATISTLIKNTLVYQAEMFKFMKLDEALPDFKKLLNGVKSKVIAQNKTIGNAQLYKLIREALVHTDTEHPNFQIAGMGKFSLKLKPKGQPEIDLILNNTEMMSIVSVFNLNLDDSAYHIKINEADLQNAIDNKKVNKNNIDNFISLTREQKAVDFDDYQRETLLDYFYRYNDLLKTRHGFGSGKGELLMSRLPCKANANNLFMSNLRSIFYLSQLSKNLDMNFEQYEQHFYDYSKKNNVPMREFVTVNPYFDIVYNLLVGTFANVATTVNKSELCSYVNNAGGQIDENMANHLRNSLAHGRYFINGKNDATVEFYDGKNTESLVHFASLNIRDINKILVTQITAYDEKLSEREEEMSR